MTANQALLSQAVCIHCGSANRIAAGHDPAAAKCGKCGKSLSLDHPAEVDDDALDKHLKRTKGLVLLDVWAPWCGPCRAMAPEFESAADQLAGVARLLKVNADQSEAIRQYRVSGIPALLLFRDGRLIDRQAGLMRSDALVQWVRSHLAPAGASSI
ncbi:MAG: thioredoxin domain-containing protein [Hyphomonadaceae bacterium]